MEYLEVLDENGNPTGKKKLRSEVHKDGDWHKAVHVWILNSKGELLLQKRSANKESHPNQWDTSSAGHLTVGLDSTSGAIKEIKEELGIKVKKDDLKYLFSYKSPTVLNNGTFINNGFFDVYLLKRNLDITKLKLQKEEISEAKFFNLDDLKNQIENKNPDFVPHPVSLSKTF